MTGFDFDQEPANLPELGRVYSRAMKMATSHSNLTDQVAAVRSRDDLVALVRDLIRDLHANPGEWENRTLDAYLEALAAWVEDMPGYDRNRGEAPAEGLDWRRLGVILLAATVYE